MVCVRDIFNQLLTYLPIIKSPWACCRWPPEALGSSAAQKMPAQSCSTLHPGSSEWSDGCSRGKPVQLLNLCYGSHPGFNLFHQDAWRQFKPPDTQEVQDTWKQTVKYFQFQFSMIANEELRNWPWGHKVTDTLPTEHSKLITTCKPLKLYLHYLLLYLHIFIIIPTDEVVPTSQ